MKHLIYTILLATLIVGCNKEQTVAELIESEDLTKIRQRVDKDKKALLKLQEDISKMEQKIAELDPAIKEYPLVTYFETKDSLFKHYIEVQGSVMTKDDELIYPEMPGVMTSLAVREGQYISKGTRIATIDDGGMEQQIAQQKIQLNLAKTTYERQKRLWEQNIGSEIQYLQAKNNYEALQEGIAAMEEQLNNRYVYAPFSGYVEEVITKQGQVVTPGATPIIRLISMNTLYVEAEVPENYLPTVKKGTKTIVQLDAIGKEYETTVKRVNNSINPASRSFVIEVNVPKDKLIKPNLIANLKLNDYTNENAILIPESVINEDAAGNLFVFVVDQELEDNKSSVKRVQIEAGKTSKDGYIEVLEGLSANQKIIGEGAKALSDGEEVQLISVNGGNE